MKMTIKPCVSILAIAISHYAQAYPGESIVLNPVTGDYSITYRSSDYAEIRLMQTNLAGQ